MGETEKADLLPFGAAWSATHARAPEDVLRAWLDLALSICDETDPIARGAFRRDIPVSAKPDRTFVTAADQEVERVVRARIRAAHPDHGLVGEEYGPDEAGARVRWIIDPIDGTHSFMRGVPIFATLLAVEVDGEVQVGVMSAPALGERWLAVRGGGAWAAGGLGETATSASARRPIRCSSATSLDDAHVLFSSRADNVASGRMPGFDALVDRAWRNRGFGDFWGYALLAEGAAEAMIETGLKIWDAAAPLLIVEEAGGRATDIAGGRRLDAGTFVASNGHLHAEILATLTKS